MKHWRLWSGNGWFFCLLIKCPLFTNAQTGNEWERATKASSCSAGSKAASVLASLSQHAQSKQGQMLPLPASLSRNTNCLPGWLSQQTSWWTYSMDSFQTGLKDFLPWGSGHLIKSPGTSGLQYRLFIHRGKGGTLWLYLALAYKI